MTKIHDLQHVPARRGTSAATYELPRRDSFMSINSDFYSNNDDRNPLELDISGTGFQMNSPGFQCSPYASPISAPTITMGDKSNLNYNFYNDTLSLMQQGSPVSGNLDTNTLNYKGTPMFNLFTLPSVESPPTTPSSGFSLNGSPMLGPLIQNLPYLGASKRHNSLSNAHFGIVYGDLENDVASLMKRRATIASPNDFYLTSPGPSPLNQDNGLYENFIFTDPLADLP